MKGRVLFLFVDGVGIGVDDPAVNPMASAAMPVLDRLFGTTEWRYATSPLGAPRATLLPLDATLGAPGTPQSGTGQAALFTGVDAVARHGGHFGPWVPVALRPLVAEESILARARRAGLRVAFANAYPEEVAGVVRGPRGEIRQGAGPTRGSQRRGSAYLRAGPPVAALGAGVLTRHTDALAAGDAVASEILNTGWRERLGRTELPVVGAAAAGGNLARIAAAHDLTFFAHYSTDSAGHTQELARGREAVELVDAFLGGILAELPADVLLVLASDHGNVEDVRAQHTRNPALGLVVGEGHDGLVAVGAGAGEGLTPLTALAPAVLRRLGVR